MRRLSLLAVMTAVVGVAHGQAFGDDAEKATARGMAGDWEATLKVSPQLHLRITLNIAEGKDGTLSGTWGSPEEGLEGLPLASIAIVDDILTFATEHGVAYKGK